MGLDFRENRCDGRIELDHGGVNFLVGGFHRRDLIVGRFLTRLMGGLHGFEVGLFFRSEARIGGQDGIAVLFHFGFFGVRQPREHIVMMLAGRWTALVCLTSARRRCRVILAFEYSGTRD